MSMNPWIGASRPGQPSSVVAKRWTTRISKLLSGSKRGRRTGATLCLEPLEQRLLLSGGDLDPTFGTRGTIQTNLSGLDFANAAALQSDGKIVAVGSTATNNAVPSLFAIVRYRTDGSLDPAFDGDGKATTSFGSLFATATGVALQSDQKIVVAGYVATSINSTASHRFALARYNLDGSLDTTFGTAGKVTTSVHGDSQAQGLVIQPDGKIVVAGSVFDANHNASVGVARYNSNGTLDTTFGAGGTIVTHVVRPFLGAQSIALRPGGQIVVAGGEDVVQYTAAGALDPGFHGGQPVQVAFSSSPSQGTFISAVALQSDGKVVIGGEWDFLSVSARAKFPGIARLNSDGSLDTSFSETAPIIIRGLALQPDGRILASGSEARTNGVPGPGSPAVTRLNGDGTVDATFHGGTPEILFGPLDGRFNAVVTQPDHKIVTLGSLTVTSTNSDIIGGRFDAGAMDFSSLAVRMYRLYNPDPAHPVHHFTTSQPEFQYLKSVGWQDESTGLPGFSITYDTAPSSTPLFRLYNRGAGLHYLTPRAGERDILLALPHGPNDGWVSEANEGFIATTQVPGTTQVSVLYNTLNGDHLYLTNTTEKNAILSQFSGIWIETTPLGFAYNVPPSASSANSLLPHEVSATIQPAANSPATPAINVAEAASPVINSEYLDSTVVTDNSERDAFPPNVPGTTTDAVFANLDGLAGDMDGVSEALRGKC